MKPFEELHISEPGLVVIEVAAADETTALAAIVEIGTRWRTSGPSIACRVAGEPGVRVRTYADTRAGLVRTTTNDHRVPRALRRWLVLHGDGTGSQGLWGSSQRMLSAPGWLPPLWRRAVGAGRCRRRQYRCHLPHPAARQHHGFTTLPMRHAVTLQLRDPVRRELW
ncbi:DUF6207 family protein [Streptomyces sp. NPDC002867]